MTVLREDLTSILKANLKDLEDVFLPYAIEFNKGVEKTRKRIADTKFAIESLAGINRLDVDYYFRSYGKDAEPILDAALNIIRISEERKQSGFVIN